MSDFSDSMLKSLFVFVVFYGSNPRLVNQLVFIRLRKTDVDLWWLPVTGTTSGRKSWTKSLDDVDGWTKLGEPWNLGVLDPSQNQSTKVNYDEHVGSTLVNCRNRLRRRAREAKASPGTCSNRKTGLVRLSGFAGRVKVYHIPRFVLYWF
jgi:hypothetical protein